MTHCNHQHRATLYAHVHVPALLEKELSEANVTSSNRLLEDVV